jgi:hypothetical protein
MTTQLLVAPVTDFPTHTEPSQGFVPADYGSLRPSNAPGRTPWVVLDRTWARGLGVQRTSGEYRINRRELVARMAEAETAGLLKVRHGSHLTPTAA